MLKRSSGGSFPRFGQQWFVALALLAAVVLGTTIAEEAFGHHHPSHDAAMPVATTPAQSAQGTSYPVPAASEVFANTPAPQSTEVIPSF
jgi:hypothetical protein